jgi:[FeFe] hydrogenase H-cluster maturation GTPase HydF
MWIRKRERCVHIGIFGRKNTGKSGLLTALARQTWANVLEAQGRDGLVAEKVMDFFPLGPALFFDTPGIDDTDKAGRMGAIHQTLNRVDLAAIITEPGQWGEHEEWLANELISRGVPFIVVVNKSDMVMSGRQMNAVPTPYRRRSVQVSTLTRAGLNMLRRSMLNITPAECLQKPSLLEGLMGPEETALLVVPSRKAHAGSHASMHQTRVINDLLGNKAVCLAVSFGNLAATLSALNSPPGLVITDPQNFLAVATEIPPGVPLTCSSMLYARQRGYLTKKVEGMMALGRLKAGGRVLMAEACTKHTYGMNTERDDMRSLLIKYAGGDLKLDYCFGLDFPPDIGRYEVVISCSACALDRREMLERIMRCEDMGVPITNSDLATVFCMGIFERALEPFSSAHEICRTTQRNSAAI